jgi:hypothetical protein
MLASNPARSTYREFLQPRVVNIHTINVRGIPSRLVRIIIARKHKTKSINLYHERL